MTWEQGALTRDSLHASAMYSQRSTAVTWRAPALSAIIVCKPARLTSGAQLSSLILHACACTNQDKGLHVLTFTANGQFCQRMPVMRNA